MAKESSERQVSLQRRTGTDLSSGKVAKLRNKLLEKKSITRRGLATYIEKLVAVYAPETIPHLLEQIRQGAIKGDRGLIAHGLKVYNLTPGGAGVVINNMNNNSANASATATPGKGFDSIVRQLSARDNTVEADFEMVDEDASS